MYIEFIHDNGEAIESLTDNFAMLYQLTDGREFVVCYEGIVYKPEAWELFAELEKTNDDHKIHELTTKLQDFEV